LRLCFDVLAEAQLPSDLVDMIDHVVQRRLVVNVGRCHRLTRPGHVDVEAPLLELVVALRPPIDCSEVGRVCFEIGRFGGEPVLLVDEEVVDKLELLLVVCPQLVQSIVDERLAFGRVRDLNSSLVGPVTVALVGRGAVSRRHSITAVRRRRGVAWRPARVVTSAGGAGLGPRAVGIDRENGGRDRQSVCVGAPMGVQPVASSDDLESYL
jgi:hypothetical protein